MTGLSASQSANGERSEVGTAMLRVRVAHLFMPHPETAAIAGLTGFRARLNKCRRRLCEAKGPPKGPRGVIFDDSSYSAFWDGDITDRASRSGVQEYERGDSCMSKPASQTSSVRILWRLSTRPLHPRAWSTRSPVLPLVSRCSSANDPMMRIN